MDTWSKQTQTKPILNLCSGLDCVADCGAFGAADGKEAKKQSFI
jgi:hypothetical protein